MGVQVSNINDFEATWVHTVNLYFESWSRTDLVAGNKYRLDSKTRELWSLET